MTRRVVRRKPRESPAVKPKPKGYTEIAWLREHGEFAECSCGKLRVEIFETDAIITGQHGWIQQGQWITCGVDVKGTNGCLEQIRLSPRIVWETNSGRSYTSGMFLRPEETDRRVS